MVKRKVKRIPDSYIDGTPVSFNPIHPHCGPGNKISTVKSENEIDEACRQHDIEYLKYQKLGKNPYIEFNKADERFITKMESIGGLYASAYAEVFKFKKEFARGNHFDKRMNGRYKRKRGRNGRKYNGKRRTKTSNKRKYYRSKRRTKSQSSRRGVPMPKFLYGAPENKRIIENNHTHHITTPGWIEWKAYVNGHKDEIKASWESTGYGTYLIGGNTTFANIKNYIKYESEYQYFNPDVHDAELTFYRLYCRSDIVDTTSNPVCNDVLEKMTQGWADKMDATEYSNNISTTGLTNCYISTKLTTLTPFMSRELASAYFIKFLGKLKLEANKSLNITLDGKWRGFDYEELQEDDMPDAIKNFTSILLVKVHFVSGIETTSEGTKVGYMTGKIGVNQRTIYKFRQKELAIPLVQVSNALDDVSMLTLERGTQYEEKSMDFGDG